MRFSIRTWSVIGAIVVLALLLPPPGMASPANLRSPSPAPLSPTPQAGGAVPVNLTINSRGINLSSLFWGTTVTPHTPIYANVSSLVEATPARVIVWPGASAGDEYDPIPTNLSISVSNPTGVVSTSGSMSGPTQIHTVGSPPVTVNASASEAEFVQWCRSINCTAIMQVPGEVNNTTLAQQIVAYTEDVLHFKATAWEIGNEPEIWRHWNCPWQDWDDACRQINLNLRGTDKDVTPIQYAWEVNNYTQAMRVVDPNIQIIGVPVTGRNNGNWSVTAWANATVQINGPNLTGVAFHDYPAGNSGNSTLAQFYAFLASPAGLPARVNSIRQGVNNTMATYWPGVHHTVQVWVTEDGSGLSHYGFERYSVGYPGALSYAAQAIQGMALNVTNMDVYASVFYTSNSWFDAATLVPRPDYTLFSEILPHLGTVVYPATLTPPNVTAYYGGSNRTLHANLYAIATTDPSDSNRADLMAVNLNTSLTAPNNVSFTPQLPGISPGNPVEVWYWNGTEVNGTGGRTSFSNTPEPVAEYLPNGLPSTWTLPAQSLVLFESYPNSAGVPIQFTESGLPNYLNSGQHGPVRWFVDVNGQMETTNHTGNITAFLPRGTYSAQSEAVALPLTGKFPLSVTGNGTNSTERLEPFLTNSIVVGGSPTTVPVQFVNQSSLTLTMLPSDGGTVSPSVSWLNASVPTTLVASANPGFVFSHWSGYGPGNYSGKTDPVTVTPTGPISEKAFFTSAYSVTFQVVNLPPGTPWNVTIRGLNYPSSSTNLTVPERNGTYAFQVSTIPRYHLVKPANLTFVIAGASPSPISLVFAKNPYQVELAEEGLPTGTIWSVTVRNVSYSSTNSSPGVIVLTETSGTYGYQLGSVPGYRGAPENSSFGVNGANLTVPVLFVATFPVTFEESGLPTGMSWNVTVRGIKEVTTGAVVAFQEKEGKYGFQIGQVSGYRAVPSNYSFSIQSQALTITITFVPLHPPPTRYTVTFDETGLPAGASWFVTVRNSSFSSDTPAITAMEINGTFGYHVSAVTGFVAQPSSWWFDVDGSPIQVAVTFTQVDIYKIIWTETGLGRAPVWSILVDGAPHTGGGAWTNASLLNGTHFYRVLGPPGYAATPASGSISVDGISFQVRVTFEPIVYSVIFAETGLPAGAMWRVYVGDLSEISTVEITEFQIRNGTFNFTVVAPHGYSASPRQGTRSVEGNPSSLLITFSPIPDGPLLPSIWAVGGAALTVVAALGVATWGTFAVLSAVRRGRSGARP